MTTASRQRVGRFTWSRRQEAEKATLGGLAPTQLFPFRADPADALDRKRRAAGFFGDLAVLLEEIAAHGLVAVQTANKFRGHAPVGTLRAVFIDDVEKGQLAFGIGPGFVSDKSPAVKEKKRLAGSMVRNDDSRDLKREGPPTRWLSRSGLR
jgi:hypothetical protein